MIINVDKQWHTSKMPSQPLSPTPRQHQRQRQHQHQQPQTTPTTTHKAAQDGRYGGHGPNDVTRRLGLGVFFFLIYSSTNISMYKIGLFHVYGMLP